MARYFGNTEALGRPLAPGGFNSPPSLQLPGFIEFGHATFRAGASEAERPRNNAGLLGSWGRRHDPSRRARGKRVEVRWML
jgi:hypothetical protein